MASAARQTDMHTCPLFVVSNPHIGGPIVGPCVSTVFIGGLPAAVVSDTCVCAGAPDTIIKGSSSVIIGGKPAARQGDVTAHGGVITGGYFTVQIGD